MHLASLKEVNAYKLPAGVFVLDDCNAAESLARGEAVLNEAKLNLRPFVPSEDWNGRKILFYRSGAKGDLLFCTPTLREIKSRWPSCEITFATMRENMPALENNPDVEHLVEYPMLLDDFTKFDAYFVISDTIHDGNPATYNKHAVDLILEMGGLETEDKELRYEVSFQERSDAWSRFPKGTMGRIGVQLMASTPSRTWPRPHVAEFSKLAIKAGFEVVWLGPSGATGNGKTPPPEHLIDPTRCQPPLSLRESIALLSTCDGFVGSDSLFLHVSGALSIPSVGLYGSFPSEIRTKYAASIKAMDGEPLRPGRGLQPCNPCYHSFRKFPFQMWPANGPCAASGHCNVLASIEPDRVLTKLLRHMRKFAHRNGSE